MVTFFFCLFNSKGLPHRRGMERCHSEIRRPPMIRQMRMVRWPGSDSLRGRLPIYIILIKVWKPVWNGKCHSYPRNSRVSFFSKRNMFVQIDKVSISYIYIGRFFTNKSNTCMCINRVSVFALFFQIWERNMRSWRPSSVCSVHGYLVSEPTRMRPWSTPEILTLTSLMNPTRMGTCLCCPRPR